MIRQMLSLALDAAVFEARRFAARLEWARTTTEPAKPVPTPPSKWASSTFHIDALQSSACPDCFAPKNVGAYRCRACTNRAVTGAP